MRSWLSGPARIGVLLYVYGIYPLLLALAGPFRRDVHRGDMLPSVCLLIAANDEASVIGAKLQNSLELDYPADKLRVLIASDGSVDGTNEIVAACKDPRVTLLAFPARRGKISSINDAMLQIDAEIVVLSDANTFLQKDAMRQLVANFADPAVGAASGDVALTGPRALLAGSEDLYYWYERTLQRLESRLGSMVGVDGALYAIRRRAVRAAARRHDPRRHGDSARNHSRRLSRGARAAGDRARGRI